MQERALGQAMGLHVGGWPLGPWALRAEHAGPIRTRGLGRQAGGRGRSGCGRGSPGVRGRGAL